MRPGLYSPRGNATANRGGEPTELVRRHRRQELRARSLERHSKLCSPRIRFHFNLSIVVLNKSSDDVQPQSASLANGLRREEGIKDAVADRSGNAGAIIRDANHDATLTVTCTLGLYIDSAVFTYRIQRITDEVRPDLVEFARKTVNEGEI